MLSVFIPRVMGQIHRDYYLQDSHVPLECARLFSEHVVFSETRFEQSDIAFRQNNSHSTP